MKLNALLLILCLSLPILCGAGDNKNIEQAVRDMDEQWSRPAGSKDVDKTVSFYSADAVVLPPNAAAVTTKDEIRSAWKDMLTSPSATIS